MTDIVWQDPPAPALGGRGKPRAWVAEAAQLKAHPKRWALLKTCKSRADASSFKHSALVAGRVVAFRPLGAWEFRVSGCDLYARYVGEDTTTEETR